MKNVTSGGVFNVRIKVTTDGWFFKQCGSCEDSNCDIASQSWGQFKQPGNIGCVVAPNNNN